MDIKTDAYLENLRSRRGRFRISSARQDLIQLCMDLTGAEWGVVFGKSKHLKGKAGLSTLRDVYDKAMKGETDLEKGHEPKRLFWYLLKQTKVVQQKLELPRARKTNTSTSNI